jgi:hypothetical protein
VANLLLALAFMASHPVAAAEAPPDSSYAPSPATAKPAPKAPADPDSRPVMLVRPPVPILLDPNDLGLGSTVVFDHVPNAKDLNDLSYLPSVQHVVLTLPAWPEDYAKLEPMQASLFPEGSDLIVVLPGYPRTHAAVAAWNLVHRPLRIVVVVPGPPSDRSMILELNALRGLERVICDTQDPNRSGFDRLQRPLSFRVFRP